MATHEHLWATVSKLLAGSAGPRAERCMVSGCGTWRAGDRVWDNKTSFYNLDSFYAARVARKHSGETDYGVHWTGPEGAWPTWRVSYVQTTGEVYAARQGPDPGPVIILGTVPVAAEGPYYRTLDGLLDGWANACLAGKPLSWVTQRLAQYGGN